VTAKSILIIDDDELICEMFSSMLSLEGYQVEIAENGAVGLDAVARRRFDLVLLDLVMPELDGVRFLHLLPSRVTDIPPILIVSASIPRGTPDHLRMPGVVGMVCKPVQPRAFLDQVAGVLAERATISG
jgi:DNA-binding response OmpR family regulator